MHAYLLLKNIMNEAFTTAEHPMLPFMSQNHSSVEKNTKLCYYSKTTALKSKKNRNNNKKTYAA